MVTVIGLGFVGLTTALGFAKQGIPVYGVEVDPVRIGQIAAGTVNAKNKLVSPRRKA